MAPLAGRWPRSRPFNDTTSLSAYLGGTLNSEVDGLTANADHVFGVFVNQGFEDSKRCMFHLLQGGLGLPDRDAYLDPSPKAAALRDKYQAHIAAILKLAGIAASEARAARVLALGIADRASPRAGCRRRRRLQAEQPVETRRLRRQGARHGLARVFHAAGIAGEPAFIVWQPSAVTGVSALVGERDRRWRGRTISIFI